MEEFDYRPKKQSELEKLQMLDEIAFEWLVKYEDHLAVCQSCREHYLG